MPARNTVKHYSSNAYYHIYNRGVAKQSIFLDSEDKKYFLKIVARHLDPSNTDQRYDGVVYKKYNASLELLSYCLMGNHFHMLFYMGDDITSLQNFVQSSLTAYTMYFNKKYKRVGPLFQGVFKASKISSDAYLIHISRYIHLNPRRYKAYYYSSLQYYVSKESPAWLKPQKIISLFTSPKEYMKFIEEYDDTTITQDDFEQELANK